MPAENLLTPDYLRRLLWTPPATRDPDSLAAAVDASLAELGARAWQIELVSPVVTQAILDGDKPAPKVETVEESPEEQAD